MITERKLPPGWATVPIGHVLLDVQYGLSLPSNEDGNVAIVGMKDLIDGRIVVDPSERVTLSDSELDTYLLRNGDILLNRTNSPALVGKTSIFRGMEDAVFASYLVRLNVNRGKANPDFINHLLNSDIGQRKLKMLSTRAVSQANINPTVFREHFNIPLPPLAEQEIIADLLSCWDSAIEKAEQLIAAKERLLHGLYQRLFGLSSHSRAGWRAYQLSELLVSRNERSAPSDALPLYSLTIENGVTPKTERYDREFLVKDAGAKQYAVVHPGDIVFNPSNLRWGAIARARISTNVVVSPIYEVLKVREEKVNGSLLGHVLTCPRQIAYFATKTEGTLIERMAVKLDAFLHAKIYLPAKKTDQDAVAVLLDEAAHEIYLHKNILAALKEQKRGLMQKLLTGRWRVI